MSYFRFVTAYHEPGNSVPLSQAHGWWKRMSEPPKEEEVIDNVFRLRKRNSEYEVDLLGKDDFDTVFRLKKRKN